jgi:hypothetical protein
MGQQFATPVYQESVGPPDGNAPGVGWLWHFKRMGVPQAGAGKNLLHLDGDAGWADRLVSGTEPYESIRVDHVEGGTHSEFFGQLDRQLHHAGIRLRGWSHHHDFVVTR